MARGTRVFLVGYAVAVVVVAVMIIRKPDMFMSWPALATTTAAGYVVVALGFLLSKNWTAAPARWWLALLCASALAGPVTSIFYLHDEAPWFLAPMWLLVVGYMAVTLTMLRRLGARVPATRRFRRVLLPASLAIGPLLVFFSVFMRTSEGTGWRILARQTPWITSRYNAVYGATDSISWLASMYAAVGYVFYALAILGAAGVLTFLIWSRFSTQRLNQSSLFLRLTALVSLATFWVLTDIYWGWLSVFSFLAQWWWVALLAFASWLGALVFGVWLVRPLAHGNISKSRLRLFLVFLLPAGTFNMNMLAIYFMGDEFIDFPGLGLLIIGLLLEIWAMIALVAASDRPARKSLSATASAS